MLPQGKCRLCGCQGELQLSHIVPAFVFRWLKDGGFIRNSRSINRRVQDGPKDYLLCRTCEQLFSGWENNFAQKIFHPYNANPTLRLTGGSWLLKFCVSVSWRTLVYSLGREEPTHFTQNQMDSAARALDIWTDFLMGRIMHPGAFEQHLLVLGALESATDTSLPPNINRYLMRGVELDLAANKDTAFVYSKFGRFALFGFIEAREPKSWRGTRIPVKSALIEPRSVRIPHLVWRYLAGRSAKAWQAMESISPAQSAKIENHITANANRFAGSDVFVAMERDVEMFGTRAFAPRARRQ